MVFADETGGGVFTPPADRALRPPSLVVRYGADDAPYQATSEA